MTSPVAICGKGFSAEKKQTSTDHQFNQAFLIHTKLGVRLQSEESIYDAADSHWWNYLSISSVRRCIPFY